MPGKPPPDRPGAFPAGTPGGRSVDPDGAEWAFGVGEDEEQPPEENPPPCTPPPAKS